MGLVRVVKLELPMSILGCATRGCKTLQRPVEVDVLRSIETSYQHLSSLYCF